MSSPRKPPVGLEFQLTPLYLQANPDVDPNYPTANKESQADPVPPEINVVHLPPENPLLNFDEEELLHMQREAFLWGFASGFLVIGTIGLIWMILKRN